MGYKRPAPPLHKWPGADKRTLSAPAIVLIVLVVSVAPPGNKQVSHLDPLLAIWQGRDAPDTDTVPRLSSAVVQLLCCLNCNSRFPTRQSTSTGYKAPSFLLLPSLLTLPLLACIT
jgi:hypothetical protein